MNRTEGGSIMFLKFIAAAAIVAAPAVVHAQTTTPTNPTTASPTTYPQDTTRSSTRIHTDSTKIDSANGSVITTDSMKQKHDRIRDTTNAGKTPPSHVHTDSTSLHSDSSMNVSPTDSTRMRTPPNSGRTPPR
jgi:hypothetical protein